MGSIVFDRVTCPSVHCRCLICSHFIHSFVILSFSKLFLFLFLDISNNKFIFYSKSVFITTTIIKYQAINQILLKTLFQNRTLIIYCIINSSCNKKYLHIFFSARNELYGTHSIRWFSFLLIFPLQRPCKSEIWLNCLSIHGFFKLMLYLCMRIAILN